MSRRLLRSKLSWPSSLIAVVCAAVIATVIGYFGFTSDNADKKAPGAVTSPLRSAKQRSAPNVEKKWRSEDLQGELTIYPGVFPPWEAQHNVIPLMRDNAKLFEDKTVLEIGVGSGINSIYAAKLGARKVVATDISEAAIFATRRNAEALGVASIVEPRLVRGPDTTAFAVIRPDEAFDVILSNPPYALDLDRSVNTPTTDSGDLGFSIVDDLDRHLKPDGRALLLYNSLFYHLTMVKYAKHKGFAVRNHRPSGMMPWAVEYLFNSYLQRLLEHRGVEATAFRFDWRKDALKAPRFPWKEDQPLFGAKRAPATSTSAAPTITRYEGWIVIQRKSANPVESDR